MAGRKRTISNAEILQEVALAPDPVVTASELAGRVGMTSSGMNKRIDELVAEGYLKERQVGARAVVYWLTDEGKQEASEV